MHYIKTLGQSMRQLLSILLGAVTWSPALACSCETIPPVASEVARAHTVFVGRVMKMAVERRIAEPGLLHESEVLVCTFSVAAPIKGVTPGKIEVVVITALQGSACGFPFEIGSSYLVYASVFRNELETSICRRTRLFDTVGKNEAEEARQVATKGP